MSESKAKQANVPWMMPYLTVRDPDASLDLYERAFDFEPENMFWGDRCACVMARDGYARRMAMNVGEFDRTKIPR